MLHVIIPVILLLLLIIANQVHQDTATDRQVYIEFPKEMIRCSKSGIQLRASDRLKVGDFVLVRKTSVLPADVILLACDPVTKFCRCDESKIMGGTKILHKKSIPDTQRLF